MQQDIDLRSIRYVDTINDNLICCICQTPFIEPVISQCGHTFCQYCIYQSLESSPVCPIDRAILSIDEFKPAAKIISNMVNELLVYCTQQEQGCNHVGQRQFIESHLKNSCEYSVAPCEQIECKELLLKKDLNSHIETCQYRTLECNMCKKKMCAYKLEDHYNTCPFEIMTCPYCDTLNSRSEHNLHISKECPKYTILCDYNEFGCDWKDERQYLNEHILYCPYESIKNYLFKQQQSEKTLRNELLQVHKENESLKRQYSDTKQHIETITNQLDLMFPGHFLLLNHNNEGSDTNENDITEESRNENMLSENQRMNNELETISANLASLELKQNMALMTETFRLQEELQSLRAICHGLRMQMHYVLMDRRTSYNNNNNNNSSSSNNNSNSNSNSNGSNNVNSNDNSNTSRMRTRIDTSGIRQETKL